MPRYAALYHLSSCSLLMHLCIMSVVLSFVRFFPEVLTFLFDSIHGVFTDLSFHHSFVLSFLPSICLNLSVCPSMYPSTHALFTHLFLCLQSMYCICLYIKLPVYQMCSSRYSYSYAHLFAVSIEGLSMYIPI